MALQNVRIALTATDDTKGAQKGVDALEKQLEELEKSWKQVASSADASGKKMKSAAESSAKSINDSTQSANKLGSSLKSVGGAVVAYFAVDQLKEFATKIINVTSEFQKFEAVLTNTLGSNTAAQVAQQKVAEAAEKTNFSVQQLTDTYIKFANRGIKLTNDELRKLADIANSTGKSIDQLTEAALDSFTGENERLKDFGIVAKKTGETTQFTFKGITTEVKNTQEAVKAYIFSLGDLQGVSGSTNAIVKTLDGQISNFGDALNQLFVVMGKGVSGPFGALLSGLTSYVTWVKEALTSTEEWQNQIANTRADEFVESFKKMGTAVQSQYIDRIQRAIEAQKFLIEQAEKKRVKTPAYENNLGVKTPAVLSDKSDEQKQYELSLLTNQKKLELLFAYLKERAKANEKAGEDEIGLLKELQNKITALQKEQLESRSKTRVAAITKEIEDVKVQIEELLNPRTRTKVVAEIDIDKDAALQGLKNSLKEAIDKFNDESADGLKIPFVADAAELKEKLRKELEGETDPIRIVAIIDQSIANQQKQYDSLEDLEKKHVDRIQEIRDIAAEADRERLEEVAAYKKEKQQAEFDTAVMFTNALFEFGAQQNQRALEDSDIKRKEELRRVGEDKQAQAFINAKFDKQQSDLKRKQAIADKAAGIFNVVINTAQGIAKTIATLGFPLATPFVAAAAIQGAIQAALIASRPIPKFFKGTEYVRGDGFSDGVDTVPAYLTKGERVVPAKENRSLMGIPNADLPRLADIYRNGSTSTLNMKEMLAAQKETTQAIKRMKVYSTEIKESGLIKVVETNNSKTRILNEQFSI